jgi:hypothetical protein
MLLTNCICASPIQLFNLFTIRSFQWAKGSDVTGLELMGGVRRNTAEYDIILKTILQDFERLVRSEAVINENPWLLIRPYFGLGIEHTFDPFQTDLGVGIPRFGARIMPSRGGIRGPVASMGCGWLDDH